MNVSEHLQAPVSAISRHRIATDGDGVTTLVVFHSCPLRCRWCHNPEGLRPEPQVQFFREHCIGCGRCKKECKYDAIIVENGHARIDNEKCTRCGECAAVCPCKCIVIE